MYPSRYNLLVPFPDSEQPYLLLNPLSGSADLVAAAEAGEIMAMTENGRVPANPELAAYLTGRGYLLPDGEAEEGRLRAREADFGQALAASPVQLLVIPTYECNLACSYCFQRDLPPRGGIMSLEVARAFFAYVEANFLPAPAPPLVTLFGGEPLLASPRQEEIVSFLATETARRSLELAVVTNGYYLEQYEDILSQVKLREIQVTLDGPAEVHDSRRPTGNGQGTYAAVVAGLETAVRRGWPVNLRVVVDRANLPALPELARELEVRGWLDLPPERFKTQIGRRYQPFDCPAARTEAGEIFSRHQLWEEFLRLSEKEPVLSRFHPPDFLGLRQLALTGEMPLPLFDACPGGKGEWAFDLYGDIYPCTATCGRPEYRLGTFYPQPHLDMAAVAPWQQRSVRTIPACQDCPQALFCGGGCGAMAASNRGSLLAPDCRPVTELLALGAKYYRKQLLAQTTVVTATATG
ncbi:MAG: radical SAM protein [Clostridia bacterium]|nr:MAG: radical SAM protein [Clostridia bacterium]